MKSGTTTCRQNRGRGIRAPVDTSFSDPEMAAASRELAHGGVQRGTAEPVGSDLPPRGRSAGELQADDLPATTGTTEACPFSEIPQFRDVDGTVRNHLVSKECGATYGGKAKVAPAAQLINLTQEAMSCLVP